MGYTRLEYLESNGSQYIDTGFKPDQDTRVVCEFQYSSVTYNSWECLFGSRISNTQNTQSYSFWNTGGNVFSIYNGGSSGTSGNSFTNNDLLGIHYLEINRGISTLDNETISYNNLGIICEHNLYLYGVNSAGVVEYTSSAKIYSFRIWDNGVLARDYIPCTNETGKKGLYDTVTGSFEGLRGSQICLITTEVDSSWDSFYQEAIIESVINFSEKIKSDLYISCVHKESDEYMNLKSHYTTIRVLSNKNQTIVNSCFESEGYISSAAQIVSVSPAYDEWYTYKPEEVFILNNIQIVNINNRKYVKLTYPSDGILSISLYCNPGDYTMTYNINIEISNNDTYDLGELSYLHTYAIFYAHQTNSKYAYHYQALKYV